MPLIGVIDPSHDERKADEPGRYPRWLPLEEVLGYAYSKGPKWSPYTYELLNAALKQHQERNYISTSLLAGSCARTSVLERKEDYIASIDSMWAAFRGTMIHRTLEYAARPGAVAEWRFFTTVQGETLSCSPDLVTPEPEATLWDWKTSENPPQFGYPWRNHTLQVQFNRYIVNRAEKWLDEDGAKANIPFNPRTLHFEHVVVVYLTPKGPKPIEVEKKVPHTFKNGKEGERKAPNVWTDDEVEKELLPRLEAMAAALDSYPEWPEGLEKAPGWAGPPGWKCPGPPVCYLPACLAKRYPHNLVWAQPDKKRRRKKAV